MWHRLVDKTLSMFNNEMPLPHDNNDPSLLFQTLDKNVAVVSSKMETIALDVKEIRQKLDGEYATKEWVDAQYGQTKKIVNGIVVTILSAVIVALLALVIKK